MAWPMDGHNDVAAGPNLARQYRDEGINCLPEHAHFSEADCEDGRSAVSVEAGLSDMLTRMETGRWRVFEHLNDWFAEFGTYHRKDGKIVKERDDLMSASRYATMMIRFAITKPKPRGMGVSTVGDRRAGY